MTICPICDKDIPLQNFLKHVGRHGSTGVGNKLHAVKKEVDGYVFDSGLEAQRYSQLCLLMRVDAIRDLEVHPKFPCVVNGIHVCNYTADFRYFDVENNAVVVEDVKGVRMDGFVVRMKLTQAIYGIKIVEVTKEMIG